MFRALCRSSSGTSTVLAASGLHTLAVPTSVCKPEAASTVEDPDDERHNARNMLNY